MEIIDVTFNFKLYEDLTLDAIKDFVQAADAMSEMKEFWLVTERLSELDKTDVYFQEYYKKHIANDNGDLYKKGYEQTRKDIKRQIIEAIGELKVRTKGWKKK